MSSDQYLPKFSLLYVSQFLPHSTVSRAGRSLAVDASGGKPGPAGGTCATSRAALGRAASTPPWWHPLSSSSAAATAGNEALAPLCGA